MLTKAALLMTDMASYINESKRKKEIILKYRDCSLEEKLSHRITKLNMHAISKKASRISMQLKTTLGINQLVIMLSSSDQCITNLVNQSS